jgi:glycerol kinase
MKPVWLALDVGTHAVRAALVDESGTLDSVFLEPVGLRRLDARRVEQDPQALLGALRKVIDQALATDGVQVMGAGLACQRSTVVAWRRDEGAALGHALSWQDTRGFAQVADLAEQAPLVRARSGLVLSPHYGASKLRWLQEHHGDVPDLCLSPLVTYLLHHLLQGGPCVCDESNAGRTQLWNLRQRQWDEELLQLFGVQQRYLPEVLPTLAEFGRLRQGGIPLRAVAGDQNAALMGTLPPDTRDALLANLGSGAFVLGFADADTAAPQALLEGLAYSSEQLMQPIWEGTVNGAGLALSWFADQPEVTALGGEKYLLSQLPTWLADEDCCGTLFRNTIGGVGSPFWRSGVSPGFLPDGTGVAARAVAVVESIGFLTAINVELLRRAQPRTRRILVTGGLARLAGLCQRLADLQQLPVARLAQTEATLLGCARLASRFAVPLAQMDDTLDNFQPRENRGLLGRMTQFQDWLMA